MGAMLAAAYATGGSSAEVAGKLQRMLTFWADKGVFAKDTIDRLQQQMMSGDAAAALAGIQAHLHLRPVSEFYPALH